MKNRTNIKKEVKIMRKMIMILFFVVLSVVLIQGNADAKITGYACSTCHTMHNSQDGVAVDTGGPFSFLLKGYASGGGTSCWGCHSSSSSTVNVDASTNAPLIDNDASVDLAGGNFGYITGDKTATLGTTSNRGHNVKDLGVTDSSFDSGTYPPGDEYNQTTLTKTNFTCAGQFGCHGDRTATDEYTAVKGAHHFVDDMLKFGGINDATQAQTTGTNGTDVGSSYRFLKGVKGAEDSLWEGGGTLSAIVHNVYKGATSPAAGTVSTPGGGTISGLCNECHGNFHGVTEIGGNTSSPFTRHPADIALPTSGDYAGYSAYNPLVPIAKTTIPDTQNSTMLGATVMCLSCHRAHATKYPDILRWDYTKMLAGNAATADRDTGCFACHTGKDGN